jgi:hypothetical protein
MLSGWTFRSITMPIKREPTIELDRRCVELLQLVNTHLSRSVIKDYFAERLQLALAEWVAQTGACDVSIGNRSGF